jgi:predicted transcriptional regulator
MTILKNCEVRFAQLNPERPSTKLKKTGRWSIQIFTRKKEQAKEWKDLNIKVKMAEDDTGVFYTANIAKNAVKSDGTKAEAPKVVNGNLVNIDPKSIGNGSICNIRIFQYDYTYEGTKGIATMLLSVQVLKHIVYRPKAGDFEDFEQTDTETIDPEETDGDNNTPEF